MREHQSNSVAKSGRPEWLDRAHEMTRRAAWHSNIGSMGHTETREETKGGKIIAVVAEVRSDIATPDKLKHRVKSVFVKTNTAIQIDRDQVVGVPKVRSHALVITFKSPQNGIQGMPVTSAETRKLRKEGHTHVVVTSTYDPDRDHGWWIGFYKPKGGHAHRGEKGGELIAEFGDELFVLQYLYENDLLALYGIPLVKSWSFLPKTDDMREEENAAATAILTVFGRPARLHEEGTYHRARLLERFRDLYRDSAADTEELDAKAQHALAETVIGQTTLHRIADGTFEVRVAYLSNDDRIAYAIYNTSDGQSVVKINLEHRTVEVGLVKCDQNGLALMALYDSFLTSTNFHEIPWVEFATRTTGIPLANLTP